MPSSGPPCCSPATRPSSGRRGRVGADPHKVWVLVRGRAEQRRLAITSQRIPAPGAADTGGTPSGTKPRRWARTLTPRSPPRARHPLIRAAQSRGEYQRLAPPAAPRAAPAPAPLPRPYPRHVRGAAAAPPPPQPYAGRAQAVRRRAKPKRTPFDVAVVTTLQKRHGVPAPQERAQRGAGLPDLRPLLPGRRDRGPRGRVRRAGLWGRRARAPGTSRGAAPRRGRASEET